MEDKAVLAIDYGTRRVGIAKSDPMGILASPLVTLEVKSDRDALDAINSLIQEYNPRTIVIGYPLLQSGDKSAKCLEIDRFIEQLSRFYDGPIVRVDEADTSNEAASILRAQGRRPSRDKVRIDRVAAVLILQRYLDEQRAR